MSAGKTRVFFVINCETHIVPEVYEADHPFALLSMVRTRKRSGDKGSVL